MRNRPILEGDSLLAEAIGFLLTKKLLSFVPSAGPKNTEPQHRFAKRSTDQGCIESKYPICSSLGHTRRKDIIFPADYSKALQAMRHVVSFIR